MARLTLAIFKVMDMRKRERSLMTKNHPLITSRRTIMMEASRSPKDEDHLSRGTPDAENMLYIGKHDISQSKIYQMSGLVSVKFSRSMPTQSFA